MKKIIQEAELADSGVRRVIRISSLISYRAMPKVKDQGRASNHHQDHLNPSQRHLGTVLAPDRSETSLQLFQAV